MWGRGNTETDTELTADNPRYQEQRWGLSTCPGTVGLQAGTHSAHTLITFNVCLGSRQGPQGKGWRRPVPTKTRVPIGTPPGPLGQWALGVCDTDMVCILWGPSPLATVNRLLTVQFSLGLGLALHLNGVSPHPHLLPQESAQSSSKERQTVAVAWMIDRQFLVLLSASD